MTISLDAAGLFRFLAFWVATKAGSSGRRLHLYFWVFFLLLAVAVGNVSPSVHNVFQGFTSDAGPRRSLRYPIPRILHENRRVCIVSRMAETTYHY